MRVFFGPFNEIEAFVTTAPPSDPHADRFRLPIQSRSPVIAAGLVVAFAGSVVVVAWAIGRWAAGFAAVGAFLMVFGVGLALWAHTTQRRGGWVLWVGANALTLVRGARRRVLTWTEIGDVQLVGRRLIVLDGRQALLFATTVDTTGQNSTVIADLLNTIETRRTHHRS